MEKTISLRRLIVVFVVTFSSIILALGLTFRSRLPDQEVACSTTAPEPEQDSQTPNEPQVGFASAEITRSISELCTSGESEAVSADDTPDIDEISAQVAETKRMLESVKERLVVSTEAEHLQLAARLEVDPVKRIALLAQAMESGRNNPFLVWDAVRICSKLRETSGCPLAAWENQLLSIDGQNSESWIRIAANRYHDGDIEAAYRALQRAGTAAESRSYWIDAIEMAERGFAAGSDFAFAERVIAAFSIAAVNLADYGAYHRMCKEQAPIRAEWAYACLAYGELLERQGKTAMGASIARSIQERALEAIGDEKGLAAVIERHKKFRENRRLHRQGGYNSLAEKVLFSNPAILSGYLAAVRAHGEMAALSYIREETDRWLSLHPGAVCAP